MRILRKSTFAPSLFRAVLGGTFLPAAFGDGVGFAPNVWRASLVSPTAPTYSFDDHENAISAARAPSKWFSSWRFGYLIQRLWLRANFYSLFRLGPCSALRVPVRVLCELARVR